MLATGLPNLRGYLRYEVHGFFLSLQLFHENLVLELLNRKRYSRRNGRAGWVDKYIPGNDGYSSKHHLRYKYTNGAVTT